MKVMKVLNNLGLCLAIMGIVLLLVGAVDLANPWALPIVGEPVTSAGLGFLLLGLLGLITSHISDISFFRRK